MNHGVKINLKVVRMGFTVEEASKLCGVSERTWQRWEARGEIPAGALKRFSAARAIARPSRPTDPP